MRSTTEPFAQHVTSAVGWEQGGFPNAVAEKRANETRPYWEHDRRFLFTRPPSWFGRRLFATLLLLLVLALACVLPVAAQRPNGAGLVIRFGDGSLIYAYVQFEEEAITSEELLYRSGLDVTIAPYGGLGAGVCSIQGEGCPADNCFCHSYGSPAYFWHFYAYDSGWQELIQGSSNHSVGDGDIDGWSWTAGDSGLPAVTIDEIALLNGVDRNPPPPTPTETPPPTPTPEPTATLPPPPTNTSAPTATSPPTATQPATATIQAVSLITPPTSATATSSIGQAVRTPSPTTQPSVTWTSTTLTLPTVTIVAQATTAAVLIPTGGTPIPLDIRQPDDGSSATNLLLFGGLVIVTAGAGGFVYLRKRRAA